MKIVFVLAMLFAFTLYLNPVHAQSGNDNESDIDFTKIPMYNLPDELRSLLGDAKINIYDYSSRGVGSIIISSGRIVEASKTLVEDETHRFFVKDSGVLERILDSDSTIKEFNRQRAVHNIRLEALDFVDQMKLAVGTWVIAMFSFFISG